MIDKKRIFSADITHKDDSENKRRQIRGHKTGYYKKCGVINNRKAVPDCSIF
jgi:hypothetical protein